MKLILSLLVVILFGFTFFPALSQTRKVPGKLGENPAYFVDSMRIDKSMLDDYSPHSIATFSIYVDSTALALPRGIGKDGAIFIETRPFAHKRYWRFLKARSEEYARLAPTAESDSTMQYFINNEPLYGPREGALSRITDRTFCSIRVVNEETLQKEFGITGKKYGVLIVKDIPAFPWEVTEKR
ncbi:MAG: hypothetical protein J7576_01465 [Siphonobacter aquaeclarae]|nr:hypothetical protein [Siphonobacter aquaeclarae]